MLKTLLFGAGPGAVNYINNQREYCQFIGFIDNDSRKHGAEYAGLPVFGVDALSRLDYDQIVITTQWVADVKRQLLTDLQIDETLVVVPAKEQLKTVRPFEHQPTMELARQMILEITSRARNDGLMLWLDFGTLLGITRDGDIIPWDDDVDFAITAETAAFLPEWLTSQLETLTVPAGWSIDVLCDANDATQSVLLRWKESDAVRPFIASFSVRQEQDGVSRHMPSLGMWYAPAVHFAGQDWMLWRGVSIPVPQQTEQYLTFVYGDWRTPRQQMQLGDYAHIQESGFEQFKEAGLHVKRFI